MFLLANGTKEFIAVDLVDLTGAITDLSTYLPKFSVKKADGTAVVTLVAATASLMRINCLIDTVGVAYTTGLHKLYVSFTIGSEIPLIFASDFQVIV